MKRYVLAVAIAAFVIAPMTTQAQKGWKIRADRSTDVKDPDAPGDIKFMEMGGGLHAINPQAAVYWNPANSPAGMARAQRNRLGAGKAASGSG